ncbi:MAG TPA: hypothetical protein VGG28_30675, partial [Kofleriaceae bacterium]
MIWSNQSRILVENPLGVAASLEQELEVLRQAAEPQPRHAGLARAAQLARSAQREVGFGDLEAVRGLGDRVEPDPT